uniref:G-protein coupled receptors family 1 profile domain-containing protein n=1 Tax=Callorhinchus milii TaxID=7868 RepID=A0A4W3JJF8_CALMI
LPCGISTCITRYLVAMSTADTLVIIVDVILEQMVSVYYLAFRFMRLTPVCNLHAVLLYASTDSSVWLTLAFTFDRCVAICCQKLKTKYCTGSTATAVIVTVYVLSCVKNIPWYIKYEPFFISENMWLQCLPGSRFLSPTWSPFELIHYTLNPLLPFALILLMNSLTVRYIFIRNRRKSMILLFTISGSFILLWAMYFIISLLYRLITMEIVKPIVNLFNFLEVGDMLRLLSCCTNTFIYAVTQTRFRQEVTRVAKISLLACTNIGHLSACRWVRPRNAEDIEDDGKKMIATVYSIFA